MEDPFGNEMPLLGHIDVPDASGRSWDSFLVHLYIYFVFQKYGALKSTFERSGGNNSIKQ